MVATSTSGEDGDCLFDALGAGRYTVTAAGYAPVAMEVLVEEEAVSALQVALGSAPAGLPAGYGVPAEQR